jgi:uncharacterized protein YecT (DUF1311 family)
MKLPSLFAALAVCFTMNARAADEEAPHPIDKFYEDCVEKNGSTAGMVDCSDKAFKKWDAEMNRIYGELMKKLPAKKAAALKQSQRDWLTYRDSNFKLISEVYGSMEGTMYIPMHAYAKVRILRERTLLLKGYLELAEDAQP